MRYVVDPDARARAGFVQVVGADYMEFVEAAGDAIRRGEFTPATVSGCRAPMLVQQAISFKVGR